MFPAQDLAKTVLPLCLTYVRFSYIVSCIRIGRRRLGCICETKTFSGGSFGSAFDLRPRHARGPKGSLAPTQKYSEYREKQRTIKFPTGLAVTPRPSRSLPSLVSLPGRVVPRSSTGAKPPYLPDAPTYQGQSVVGQLPYLHWFMSQ